MISPFRKSDQIICMPGEDCDRTFEYQIRSAHIDNLSNSWIYLPDLHRYIPPLTLDYFTIFPVPTQRFRAQFVPGPAGGVTSVNTGDLVIIDVYEWVAGNTSIGTQLGSITGQSQQAQILVSANFVQPTGALVNFIAGTPLKSTVLLSWNIAYFVGPLPPVAPTGIYHFGLVSNTGLQATLQDGSLQQSFDLYPYGVTLAEGDDLFCIGNSSDASQPDFFSLIRYYIGEPV